MSLKAFTFYPNHAKILNMISYKKIAQIENENKPAALCTVTHTSGSTPRKISTKMIVIANNDSTSKIIGTIGGGAIEHKIRKEALLVISHQVAKQIQVQLTNELGMCCGGNMTIFIEPIRKKPPCIILGAGHISQSLCSLVTQIGFSCFIADPRSEIANITRFPFAKKIINNYSRFELDQLPFELNSFIIIVTHSHNQDQILVEEILKREFNYLAMVGSHRKATMTQQRCLNAGFSDLQIKRITCPAGLNIKAQTPEEIALSIAAQMIYIRRLNSKQQL